jgi:hypothetical protein
VNIRWQVARRELLYVAIAAMEICFLTPMVLALSRFARPFPPEWAVPAFFVQLLVACYLVRFLDSLGLEERTGRDVSLFVLLLWVLLVLRVSLYSHVPWVSLRWLGEMVAHLDDRSLWPRDVAVILTTLLFWWRGLSLAQKSLDVESVGLHFRAGVLVMAVSVALASSLSDWDPVPLVFAYFFVSLLAVALARVEEASNWRMAIPFPFSLGWLLAIVAAAGLAIAIALGLISLFSGEDILQTLALLGPIWRGLSLALVFVLSLLFRLLYPIVDFLISRIMGFREGLGFETPQLFSAEELLRLEQQAEAVSPFAPYHKALLVLAIASAILTVALMFRRMTAARRRLGAVDAEFVLGHDGGQGLGARLQEGLNALAGRLDRFGRWRTAASIRRIYAQMVAAAARQGYPRPPSETPYEHVAVLLNAWPGMGAQIRVITEAYVKSHYGEIPETEAEFEVIRHAWDELQAS